jgi:peptidoglycan/LPS O-acetylase OafA/YrhL
MDPIVFYARRLVRLGAQLVPLVVVLVVISAIDPTDPYSTNQNVASSVSALTFTFNTRFLEAPLAVRADLGHLWYLCVQQQIYLVLPFVLLVFHRHRRVLAAVMVALFVAVTVHRLDLVAAGHWDQASVMTSTRSDGLFLGVALALVEPALHGSKRLGTVLLPVSLVAFVALVLTGGEVGVRPYLGAWGVAGVLVATVLVAGIVLAPAGAIGHRVLSVAPLAWLGRASLVIYVWHYPILYGVARHVQDWTRPAQLLTMLATLVVVTYVGHEYVEEPTRRFLRTNRWLNPPAPPPTASPDLAEKQS